MGKKKPRPKSYKQPVKQGEGSSSDPTDDDIIAAVLTSTPQPVLMKVCRLCESKDGPFLNIFGADKVTAKKIDEIMPFVIAENDELPHKICFRCSAKVEELYEFIQKCIKTQESFRTAMGKKGPLATKTKTRVLWEEKLNKTNMSNDEICNALIIKAMEGIKEIPLLSKEEKPPPPSAIKRPKVTTDPPTSVKKEKESVGTSDKINVIYESDEEDEHEEISLKQVKLSIKKCDDKIPLTNTSQSKKSEALPGESEPPNKSVRQYTSRKPRSREQASVDDKFIGLKVTDNHNASIIIGNVKDKTEFEKEKPKNVPAKVQEVPPPINIMDHVSTIKVNGVGTLFLCKLCNRNFLKKEVVMSHGCAKNNVPKDNFMQNNAPAPELPRPSTVKYIKIDRDFKKPLTTENVNQLEKKLSSLPNSIQGNFPVQPEVKSKPRVGPASRVKRNTEFQNPKEPTPPPAKPEVSQENKEQISVPAVNFPTMPSLNSRYKLVPGPNNIFTLIEDSVSQNVEQPVEDNTPPSSAKSKKRKATGASNDSSMKAKKLRSSNAEKESNADVTGLDENSQSQPPAVERPYPVRLFQTVPHHSGVFAPSTHPSPPTFTTPAMKKHSYTVVQTGNPSKLLISSKPQSAVEEASRKKPKKSKDVKETDDEPYNVTLEDTGSSKNPGFFTFINVDPLLQPSYVLPTDNIIQESQISTSTPASKVILENKDKDKYGCNMCGEKFSREKKLLAHIQSHYNKMDEEDQRRSEKAGPKRKTRKS